MSDQRIAANRAHIHGTQVPVEEAFHSINSESRVNWQIDVESPPKAALGHRGHTALSIRASISSRNKVKSIGFANKPSAPPSIALRLVSGSP